MQIILASASPRRKQLLESIGVQVLVRASNIVEERLPAENAGAYVLRMSQQKAQSALTQCPQPLQIPLLAADTTVACGEEILEKPVDRADAERMLSLLRGRVHCVFTGVCILYPHEERTESFVVETQVKFASFSDQAMRAYIDSGEADDKAGAYGIQGRAAVFVESIVGSYTNVVGLPLYECARALGVV